MGVAPARKKQRTEDKPPITIDDTSSDEDPPPLVPVGSFVWLFVDERPILFRIAEITGWDGSVATLRCAGGASSDDSVMELTQEGRDKNKWGRWDGVAATAYY